MDKDRSAAFFDAVFAIVMTILVLELDRPSVITWQAIWDMRASFFAYGVSFFWLGTMWINIHNEWHHLQVVSNRTLWLELILLFVSSFFPYVTSLVSADFYNSVSQILYGIVVIGVTIVFMRLFSSVAKDNQFDEEYNKYLKHRQTYGGWIRYDILLKCIGLVLSATMYPPAMLLSVLVTLLFLVIPRQLKGVRDGK